MVSLKSFDVDEHYKKLRRGSLAYSFRGVLSKGLMDYVFDDIEEALIDEKRIVRKRIYNILIELLQNIYKYTVDSSLPTEKSENNEIVVIVQKLDDNYEVITGNFLDKVVMKPIEEKMRVINCLSNVELNRLYRDTLDTGTISEGSGAGLGFIDVARRSKNSLRHKFDAVDKNTSFFTVKALVRNSN